MDAARVTAAGQVGRAPCCKGLAWGPGTVPARHARPWSPRTGEVEAREVDTVAMPQPTRLPMTRDIPRMGLERRD